jgi:hypothetical protein
MFVYILCMWFVTLYAKFIKTIATPYRATTCVGYRVRYAYVPRTPVYIYRIYAQKRAIYARIMCLRVFYTCVLQFLHVFHERGHYTFDLRVLVVFSIIVSVIEEFPYRVRDICPYLIPRIRLDYYFSPTYHYYLSLSHVLSSSSNKSSPL